MISKCQNTKLAEWVVYPKNSWKMYFKGRKFRGQNFAIFVLFRESLCQGRK